MGYPARLQLTKRPELIRNYVKIYPNKIKIIQFKTPYLPPDGKSEKQSGSSLLADEDKAKEQEESHLQRAKTKISDIVDCNDFDMFVTFTSNCKKCGQNCKNDPKLTGQKSGCICDKATCKRYDLDYQRRNTFAWINHQKKIHGHFDHLMVMELHKDGAYHFHALLNGYKGKLKKHKKDRKDGKMIYNLVENKRGNTTCKIIPIEDKPKVASYVKKYITKDMPMFPGRNRYACSKGLNRPVIKRNAPNIEELSKHPNATVWMPKTEPYEDKRTHQIVYPKATIVESVTTIELDNKQNYLEELSTYRSAENALANHGAPTAPLDTPHLNSISQATQIYSLTVDSAVPGKLGL